MRNLVVLTIAGVCLAAVPVQAQSSVTAFEAAKARQLLHTQLPCLGCHALEGDGGRVAVALDSIGRRRSARWIRSMLEDPQRTMPGAAMPRIPMPDATRTLLVRYLAGTGGPAPTGAAAQRTVDPRTSSPAAAVASSSDPDGGALYGKWCAACHGATGEGDGPNAKFLTVRPVAHANARVMRMLPDDAIYDAIAAGGAARGKSARMPAFGATLSREEIRALVREVRRFCRCEGPAWSHDPAGR